MIEAEIAGIRKNLVELGRMHPGSLSKQKRSRGGEYHRLSYSEKGLLLDFFFRFEQEVNGAICVLDLQAVQPFCHRFNGSPLAGRQL